MSAQEVIDLATRLLAQWGLKVVGAVVVLVVGRILAGGVRRAVIRGLERSRMDNTLIPFLSGLVYYGVLAFVVIAVLRLFGLETTSLVAVLGAAGLAVG